MTADRMEVLKGLLEQNPEDSFARYALAMGFVSAGDLDEAVKEFSMLLSFNPDYVVAYFQAGQALEKLDRLEEASQMYQHGVAAAIRKGDTHMQSEIQAALDLLGI